jgi:septal ring factor EnvC (AmiA/AmiB activator)
VIACKNQSGARVSLGLTRPISQRMRGASNSTAVATIAVVVLLHTCASAQQNSDLQQQLQKLKQQYEQTTKDMQQRITTLEQPIENQKQTQNKIKESTISAAELAAQVGNSGRVIGMNTFGASAPLKAL